MKSTGIVRKVDELGRIVVPKEIRKIYNIDVGDSVEIFTEGEKVILRKYVPGCTFCGGMDDLVPFGGQYICGKCRETLRKGFNC